MKRWASLAVRLLLAVAPAADAAFPGGNGKIAWDGIYVMNPDGSDRQRLTTFGSNPMWSPSGRKLVADSVEGDGIFVLNEDGTGITRITESGRNPAWSPDGQKIAFVDWVFSEQRVHLFIVNADGTGRTRVTFDTIRNKDAPVWSPDGSQIAFQALEDYPSGTDWDIYSYDVAGGTTVNLTDFPDHDGEDELTPSF
jgi:Tol biopolymer transport system component